MSFESRIRRALSQADDYQPSLDLFARVVRSIEQDRAYRRRRATAVTLVLVLSAALAGLVMATGSDVDGVFRVPRWTMELVETCVALAVVIALGPAMRRSGRDLVIDLFGGESNARRFLDLLDLAYYLVFAGVIMTGAQLTGLEATPSIALLLDEARVRIAALLVVMGVLHSVNVAALPVVALLRNVTRWRATHRAAGSVDASREALQADRLVRAALVAGGIVLMMAMAFGVVAVTIGLLS